MIPTKPRHVESCIQRACVRWFDYQHPRLSDLLFAIPNGGRRSKIEAGIMKGEGVRPGMPDLMLAMPNNGYSGLFIEMKTEQGRTSPDQKNKHKRLRDAGYKVEIVRSVEQFITTITDYINGND